MALQLHLSPIPAPNSKPLILPSRAIAVGPSAFTKATAYPISLPSLASTHKQMQKLAVRKIRAAMTFEEIPPNALRRKRDPLWRGGFSLGVDLGMSRTGLALSKGFSIRPLTVTPSLYSLDSSDSLIYSAFHSGDLGFGIARPEARASTPRNCRTRGTSFSHFLSPGAICKENHNLLFAQ